jgi:hypothetical protein
MSKKKKPAYGVGQVVDVEIITMKRIDCSKWVAGSLAEWTHGPVLPVGSENPPVEKEGRETVGRKKRTPRK